MQVISTPEGQLLIVKIQENRLDSSLAVEFQVHINNWIEEGYLWVVLDLSEVDFVDSTILGVIIQWFKRVRSTGSEMDGGGGGNLVICNIGFKIRSLLQLTRMDRVFTVFKDQAEAVQAMTGDRM